MLKILPVTRNNNFINIAHKNKRNMISSTILTLSLLSPIIMNSCSKYPIELEEDKFEKVDTTNQENNNSNFDVFVDTLSLREYTYYI